MKEIIEDKLKRKGISIDKTGNIVNFSIWQKGYKPIVPSFKERLKHIWKILISGECYSDQISLSLIESEYFLHKLEELVKK